MIDVIGAKEILNVLKGLPFHLSDPVLQKIHKKAAVPLVNKIHLNAPVGLTGNLADSIGIITGGVNFKELGGIAVGPRQRGGYRGFAGHFNEYGTKKRRTRKGKNTGVMPAKPFEKPAWEATKGQVESNIDMYLEKDLTDFIRKTLAA